ncbi:helix-turn-helix domain-containing protein [Pandoraea sp. NPDC087047]|uniref:helix-turn-helix domain-containing protein n=1 Tax=Pandoraea sp. NPDC087047 TaxID=3364390 RepID=UPI003804BB70
MQTNPLALFGDHLARLRKARGWSQEKLALESGLARSYVSGIERGRRNVALVNICVLADTLGVPTSEMLRFAQATPGAEDAAVPTDRTPLPQISRSLCRLENRDQVWLAEIIRSLSSRLCHAVPPAVRSLAPPSATVSSASAHDGDFDNESTESDALDDDDELNALSGADKENAPESFDTSHPSFGNAPARAPIDPRFDAGFPARHQLAPTSQASYRIADDTANASHSATASSVTDNTTTPLRICEPDRSSGSDRDTSSAPAIEPRSDTSGHDDPRRLPSGDEE